VVLQLGAWAERDGGGIGFDSNGGCILPNGVMRSPDASWVRRGRLTNLTVEQKQKVSGNPVLQGFTLELRPIWEPGF
jgi:Uma2 family endonuclease